MMDKEYDYYTYTMEGDAITLLKMKIYHAMEDLQACLRK